MTPISLIGFIFLLLFLYGLFIEKLNRLSISGPMVFVLLGLLLSGSFRAEDWNIENEALEVIGQVALIAILFTDASGISTRDFFKVYKWPVRLLLIGLPLTMLLGTFTAKLFYPELTWPALAILAFILSPTDAALGQAVVKSERIPERIRETINVESGLNDGLVLPPILICLVFLSGQGESVETGSLLIYVGKQIILAPIMGGLIGWLGTKLIEWSVSKDFCNRIFQGISIVAISVIAYVAAEHVGGNGYISSFMAGIFFSAGSKIEEERGETFGEFLSQPLALFVFFIFGSSIVPHYAPFITLNVVMYSVLSLTVLRMVPVILSLSGTSLTGKQKTFIGWFGPRGIASILYFLLVLKHLGTQQEYQTLYATITLTVMLSIIIHGLSAVPYTNYIASASQKE
jgi:NhaP-type Na+/H+ or K+/H+ antiporter